MVGHANEGPVMNDSLREKFLGWMEKGTEGRVEEHPRQGSLSKGLRYRMMWWFGEEL